jgi:hypothetical protein
MPHGTLEWDLALLQGAMHLSADEVRAYFTDGRRVSFILERRLMREVLGGKLAASEGDDHDLVDATGRKWEFRSISSGGIYFCPSYMVGSGRRFECDGFLRKLEMIHGYVVSDITLFPKIPYWFVEAALVRRWWDSGSIGSATKIARWRALELLQTVR